MEECTYNADDLLVKFKASIYYLYFDELEDDTILRVITSLLNCPDTEYFFKKCPKIFCCWILAEIALCLFALGITDDDEGNIQVPDLSDDPYISYVKKDQVRDESREYFEPGLPGCLTCEDFPLGKIKKEARMWLDRCFNSRRWLGGVGTNYGCRGHSGTCVKDSYRSPSGKYYG